MSIERAEQLKREWTDKYVVVRPEVPQLKRFQHLTGLIKTVNMNCRALVQFNGPEDISWYDIDLEHLQIVTAPLPKKAAPAHEAEKAAPAKAPAAKSAPAKAGGKSPLEQARAQAAGGAAPAGKKLSPLEQARAQAVNKSADETAPKAAPASPPAASPGKKLSPLEQARLQARNKKSE